VKTLVRVVVAAVLLAGTGFGCGSSEKDRGKNSQLDRPMPTSSTQK